MRLRVAQSVLSTSNPRTSSTISANPQAIQHTTTCCNGFNVQVFVSYHELAVVCEYWHHRYSPHQHQQPRRHHCHHRHHHSHGNQRPRQTNRNTRSSKCFALECVTTTYATRRFRLHTIPRSARIEYVEFAINTTFAVHTKAHTAIWTK
jgi:hypothetical protein